MNLLPFTVHGGARPRLASDAVEVALSDAVATRLVAAVGEGGDVTAGIRPEHLRLVAEAGTATVSGEPYAVETLGPESLVTLKVGEALMTVRIFSDEPPDMPAGVAHVQLDEAYVHYFDGDGVRIEVR